MPTISAYCLIAIINVCIAIIFVTNKLISPNSLEVAMPLAVYIYIYSYV